MKPLSIETQRELVEAGEMLAGHVSRSVNVGPLTKNPSVEARLWVAFRSALSRARAEMGGDA